MTSVLTTEILSHIGNTDTPRREIATRRDIRKYAVATGQTLEKYLAGNEAPPLFHVTLFWPVVGLDELSPDGVFVDKLLPTLPFARAMAGGLDIDYYRPIKAGDVLLAQRRLENIFEKQGRQGTLIFYEIIMDVKTESGEPVLTEKTTRIMR